MSSSPFNRGSFECHASRNEDRSAIHMHPWESRNGHKGKNTRRSFPAATRLRPAPAGLRRAGQLHRFSFLKSFCKGSDICRTHVHLLVCFGNGVENALPLEVRLKTPLRCAHGMASVVANGRDLTGLFTPSGHSKAHHREEQV